MQTKEQKAREYLEYLAEVDALRREVRDIETTVVALRNLTADESTIRQYKPTLVFRYSAGNERLLPATPALWPKLLTIYQDRLAVLKKELEELCT